MRRKVCRITGVVLMLFSCTILLLTFVYHYRHPDLTQMQMFRQFWSTYMVAALFGIGGASLLD